MNRKDLARNLASVYPRLSVYEAESIIEHLFYIIRRFVGMNDPVHIPKFGTFILVRVKSRRVANPKTGEKITIPSHTEIRFRPSKDFKAVVKRKLL